MDTARYTALFVSESRDHLEECNRLLLRWEREPEAAESLDGLFRAVHSLKGMAASLGFVRLTAVAHAFEQLLAEVRAGRAPPGSELVELGFRAVDALETGVTFAADGRDGAFDAGALVEELVGAAGPREAPSPRPIRRPTSTEGLPVQVRIRNGAMMPAARAALVLRRAERFGPVVAVAPPPETWADEGFTGVFRFRVTTSADADEVRDALLQVTEVEAVEVGATTGAGTSAPGHIRVDPDRLDTLVALAGEVVVARNRLAAMAEAQGTPALADAVHRLGRLVADLHGQVLHTRMAPVGEVLARFPRAARDLARELGKQVRLEVTGGEIELDRAILGELPEVLLHLLRNAIDHGIEPPDVRVAAGKPAEGVLRVQAVRDRNAVVVTVGDDGRGIDREAVLARARLGGWSVATGGPGDTDLLDVLAQPGFTTAEHVTHVSGRGVGIDAVVHRVRSLGGAATLDTTVGQGTTLSLRLPLTRAIVPVLLVGLGEERYAVPLEFVAETVRLPGAAAGLSLIAYRGESLPVLDLGAGQTDGAWRPAVLLDVAGRRGVLLVDTLLGQEEIVVSPVDAPRGAPTWVNGATILADGRPALVLDPAALV